MPQTEPDPKPMDEATAVASLAALAQGMRLRIFRALVGAGPQGLTPGALSATLGVPGSTLSFHLKELTQAGLVSQQRDGRHLIYRPSLPQMMGLMDYLTAHCCQGAGVAGCDPRAAAVRPDDRRACSPAGPTGCAPSAEGPAEPLPSCTQPPR